jgi:hypothetical protein
LRNVIPKPQLIYPPPGGSTISYTTTEAEEYERRMNENSRFANTPIPEFGPNGKNPKVGGRPKGSRKPPKRTAKRKLHVGPNGGKYYLKNGKKVYVKPG